MARLFSWCGVAVLALAASIVPLHAHTFKASTVEAEATITDGLANVSFKVEITNDSASPMTNVVLVFADNTQITVGDIGGEATVTTEQQNRTVDVSEAGGTRSVAMHVTLKYSVDGENVEAPWILSVLAE
jgi:microcystin-dependent protein